MGKYISHKCITSKPVFPFFLLIFLVNLFDKQYAARGKNSSPTGECRRPSFRFRKSNKKITIRFCVSRILHTSFSLSSYHPFSSFHSHLTVLPRFISKFDTIDLEGIDIKKRVAKFRAFMIKRVLDAH